MTLTEAHVDAAAPRPAATALILRPMAMTSSHAANAATPFILLQIPGEAPHEARRPKHSNPEGTPREQSLRAGAATSGEQLSIGIDLFGVFIDGIRSTRPRIHVTSGANGGCHPSLQECEDFRSAQWASVLVVNFFAVQTAARQG